jgi:hypothetical protein
MQIDFPLTRYRHIQIRQKPEEWNYPDSSGGMKRSFYFVVVQFMLLFRLMKQWHSLNFNHPQVASKWPMSHRFLASSHQQNYQDIPLHSLILHFPRVRL